MIDYIKKCEHSMIASSIVTLLLGIILLIDPTGSIRIVTAILGLVFIIIGVYQMIDYIRVSKLEKLMSNSLIIGLIAISLGLYLFINTTVLIKFVTIIIGIALCVKSLFKIQFALNIKNVSEKWFYNFFYGLFSMLLGILLIFNPFESAELFLRIIGIVLVIGSIVEIVETIFVKKTLDDVKELDFIEKKDAKKSNKKEIKVLEEVKAEIVNEEDNK